MNTETVENYLTKYGWVFQRTDEGLLLANLAVANSVFLVVFQLDSPWLRISIPSYLAVPTNDTWPEFARLLLRLNRRSYLVRFAMDEQNNLMLCVDVYAPEMLDYSQFEVALDTLSYVADTVYSRLLTAINT